mgnify:CR=1 FL=1
MSETKSTPSLESTLKSLDTEEFIDIHFYRPIGYQWALFFNKIGGLSPNSITIASIFIGVAAGICFYFPEPRYQRDRHVTVKSGQTHMIAQTDNWPV